MQTEFTKKVFCVVSHIEKGQTLTYSDVAKLAGRPKACRAVGNILNKNHDRNIPCHRVIRSDGDIGGFNRGSKMKKILLRKERAIK